jgi:hypothetical protein
MQDRPTAGELLEAVRAFLERDVVPALDGTAKFHARVAANLLAIVGRELEHEAAQHAAEWARLDGLLGVAPLPSPAAWREALAARTAALCERIRRGEADTDPTRAAVLAHVRATVCEKLAIANPNLLRGGATA